MIREMYTPKISIVIPAYNASNYLAEAIDSALAQTYSNVEILVVNDGSKDNGATERIALSYGDKIRYFSKENGGSSSALNIGIANMTGEWFSWLSHDDLYVPEKLEKQVMYMNGLGADMSEISGHIFFSATDLVDGVGKIIRTSNHKRDVTIAQRLCSVPHNGYLLAEPTVHNFYGCSCLVHKSALVAVGGFDEELRLINDMDLWHRLYHAGYRVHYLPESLVRCRIHPAQLSKSIGYSYHNPEQDMFWNRSLDWLMDRYPEEEQLFFLYGRNAYLKTRNTEGDRAFAHINSAKMKKRMLRLVYMCRASAKDLAKKVYLKHKA